MRISDWSSDVCSSNMRGMVRALALVLVLTFATGAVAHAVQASGMAFEMAMTADGTMPGCNGCDGDDDGNNGAVELTDRKSPRLNSSHYCATRMPSSV